MALTIIASGLPTLANTTNLLRVHYWTRCHTLAAATVFEVHPKFFIYSAFKVVFS